MIYIAQRCIDYPQVGVLRGQEVSEEPHPQYSGYVALKSTSNNLYGRVEPTTGELAFTQAQPGFNEKFLVNGSLYAAPTGDPASKNPYFFLRFES